MFLFDYTSHCSMVRPHLEFCTPACGSTLP